MPRDVLQFLPCPDDDVGRRLITHPDVGAVILTGALDTARAVPRRGGPTCACTPRRAGKNAIVVTAAADLDLAVARPRALGVRPRRPEVLGRQPGHRRAAGARRRPASSPSSPTPHAPCASGRPTDLGDDVGPLIATAVERAAARR